MECKRAELLLGPFQDGELESPLREELMGHLQGCERCSEQLGWERELGERMRLRVGATVEGVSFDGFYAEVMGRIAREEREPWWKRLGGWFWVPRHALATALAVMLLVLALVLPWTFGPSTPQLAQNELYIEEIDVTQATVILDQDAKTQATIVWVIGEGENG